MKRRIIALTLACFLLVGMIPISGAAVENDYRKWAQSDSRWGSLPLGSSSCTVSGEGCTVTAVTKLIIQAGKKDPASFNVGTLVEWLNQNSGFTSGGALWWDKPAAYSGLSYYGALLSSAQSSTDANSKLIEWISNGYHLVIEVRLNGGQHWVAVDEAMSLSTGTIHIMDSLKSGNNADITLASGYSTIYRVMAYTGGTTPTVGSHVCNKATYKWQWTAHPHYSCYECSVCGEVKEAYDEVNYWSSCDTCINHVCDKGTYKWQWTAHPHYSCYECSLCGEVKEAPDEVNYWDSCETCLKEHVCDRATYKWQWTAHPHYSCYECSVCGEVKEAYDEVNYWDSCEICITLSIPDHVHMYEAVATDPTCIEKGYTTYTCSCGDSYISDEIVALGHTEVIDKAIAATCTTTGQTEGKHCTVCNEVLIAQTVVPAKGHTEVVDAAVAATCTATGLTEGKHCSVCNEVLVKQNVTPATGHNWDDGVITKQPQEGVAGEMLYTCTACKTTKIRIIPALEHVHTYEAVVTAPTCTEKGYTTYTCACGDSYVNTYTSALGHTEVIDKAVAATCTTTGLTEGKHCSVCKVVLVAQQAVPALGHTEVIDKAVAATCTTAGLTEGKHCSACNVVLVEQQTVTALGHNYTDGICNICGSEVEALEAPVVKITNKASNGKPSLSWGAVDGAAEYEVYRATSKSGTYSLVKTATSTSYVNTSAVVGKTYYYYVVAIDEDGNASENSNIVSRTCDLAQPAITLSNVASSGKIKITWDEVDGAVEYEVYRATSKSGTYSLLKTTTSTSLTNTSTTAGKTYYYKVRAIATKSAANSAYSEVKSRCCDLAQTTVTLSNVASTGKIKISWTAVDGATKYQVYRAASKDGTYSLLTTTTSTSVTNTKTDAGKTYYYKVRAICDVDAATAAYSAVKSRCCDLPRPDASIALSSSKPKVSWAKVTGAVEYKVYRATSKSGTYSLVKTTTSLSYKDTKTTAGKTYYYKVVAVCSNTSGNSAYSSIVSIKSK